MHNVKRLLTEFIPQHYNLSLVINRIGRSFTGTASVTGRVVGNKAMLHANGLNITSITVDGKASEWSLGKDDELTIGNLKPGDHIIVLGYTGTINDQLHGLYPCKYTVGGEQKELLATQFESHYAREVFPCVDEPAAKATFDVTLTTETGVTVLSNMPEKRVTRHEARVKSQESTSKPERDLRFLQDSEGPEVEPKESSDETLGSDAISLARERYLEGNEGRKRKSETELQTVTFETTPKMSTYLLAFVIGDLQKVSGQTKNGVNVNIYATPAQPAASLQFALEHSIKTIDFFEQYFGVPYPLPKSDQVALPDFANGAMENWGLITYRESALLYDPVITSIAAKQYISTVISHELSHQWFGNLVTMAWWDDLWLNESFATIMEYICVDALYPQWNVWLDFNTNESVYALRRDGLEGVQAVKVAVHHPDEIQSVFDGAIVYAKGARLMQMMQNYVGEQAFKDGLKSYFENHAYGNTTGADLWDALQAASGKDVGKFMDTWLTQSGFPVVKAKMNGGNVELTQRQFLIGIHEPNDKLWPIPLGAPQHTLPELFSTKHAAYAIDTHKPFCLNANDTAHYITNYSNELLGKILAGIKAGTANITVRAQIIKERALLVKSDEAGSETLIDLLQSYNNETNEKVWSIISGTIGDLKRFVDPQTKAETALKKLAVQLAEPLYLTLGWDKKPNESADDSMLRATIIGTMIYGEHAGAISEARLRYATQNINDMDAELRDLIMIAETRHGESEKAISDLLDVYKTSASVDIKNDIRSAVCSTRNAPQLKRLLGLLKDTQLIRTQDTAMWFANLLNNRDSRDIAWQWLQQNWGWVKTTFGGDKSYDTFPRLAGQILATRQQLNEYTAFFEPMLKDTALKRAITVGINDVSARVHLLESDKPAVEQRLINL